MSKMLVCGAINWDTMLFVDRLPNRGEEVRVMKVIAFHGGKDANTSLAPVEIVPENVVGCI